MSFSSRSNIIHAARMKKEFQMLETSPPPGIFCWPSKNSLDFLEARPQGSPYENGIFKLEIKIPERYPFEPPNVRFITPIYHVNIDNNGRICLDTLKLPPSGSWTPSLNISTLLTTISQLMIEPNPDDGLMPEIVQQYRLNYQLFWDIAQKMTRKYAVTKDDNSTIDNDPHVLLNHNIQIEDPIISNNSKLSLTHKRTLNNNNNNQISPQPQLSQEKIKRKCL